MVGEQSLPLEGLKVVEFTHMVMGPAVGVILADLGADVIKVEPLKGDNTRRLKGSGAGYFPMYNRNKQSLCIDLKSQQGHTVAKRLIETADIVIENFRPGAMEKLGFGYDDLSKINPQLIYCSLKGFLAGPYEQRTALDEVTQMMGGLAYMTGPPGQPLRAGSSVIDITGGMFGVIAILAAIEQRHRTGQGQKVTSSLFETTSFLVGQHMAQEVVSGEIPPPMSVRQSAWAVYDTFQSADDEPVFIGVVSDTQWRKLCEGFALDDLAKDEELSTNNGRVAQKDRVMARLVPAFSALSTVELCAKLEQIGLPFAPINRPHDLFEDPHLNARGGLVGVTLPDTGQEARLPALPVEMSGQRMRLRRDLPRAGEHSRATLLSLGYSEADVERFIAEGILAEPRDQR